MDIKAVVFDYGGVISFLPSLETGDELERLTGVPFAVLDKLHHKYRGEWDRGTYDGVGYYRFILAGIGVFLDDSSLALIARTDMDGWKRINPATVQLMEEIKRSGLTLGILSNIPSDFLVWARKYIFAFRKADTAVFSCEHGIIKPEAEIYQKLREQLKCEYNEIVFFDDRDDNIAMARNLGICAYLWEKPETARMLLKDIGLIR